MTDFQPHIKAKTKSRAEILEEQDRANLLGTWIVQIGNKQSHEWTFRDDGNMVNLKSGAVTGTWQIEPTAVRITWPSFIPKKNERCWESFYCPIRPQGIRGDSWTGTGLLTAVKKDATTPIKIAPSVAGTSSPNPSETHPSAEKAGNRVVEVKADGAKAPTTEKQSDEYFNLLLQDPTYGNVNRTIANKIGDQLTKEKLGIALWGNEQFGKENDDDRR